MHQGLKSIQLSGARSVEKEFDWREPNGLLVVQTGERVDQAKVFKAHAVPQGQCGILVNALKLLANQQEDGDGLIQNIVTNLCEVSRKGLTEGLRNFIQVDNYRCFGVGHLREGLGSFKVRRPKGEEGNPEVPVRESSHELTLRAEEVGNLEVVYRCRPHCKGKVGSSPSRY